MIDVFQNGVEDADFFARNSDPIGIRLPSLEQTGIGVGVAPTCGKAGSAWIWTGRAARFGARAFSLVLKEAA
jgi:hypothetical protein